MFSHLPYPVHLQGSHATLQVSKSMEKEILEAEHDEEIHSIITSAGGRKMSVLVASDSSEMDFNSFIADIGMGPFIAIELKNWINSTLHASLQPSEILDSRDSHMFGSTVYDGSQSPVIQLKTTNTCVTTNGHIENSRAVRDMDSTITNGQNKKLPPVPLPNLADTLQFYESSVQSLCSESELQGLREGIKKFQQPGNVGLALLYRTREIAGSP